jgi:D-alanyl-D-alanine carboxypeptidase (penicillin-binding protein 5/6)
MLLPAFRAVVHRHGYRLAAGSGHHAYRWTNINPLIGRYPGAIGIKTGYTRAAGQCLLFEATRNGRSVIGITLHSPGSISPISPADATRILNWAFSHPA